MLGDGRGAFCINVGNAPDDWLVTHLIAYRSPWPGQTLTRAGIEWTSELPPPPPIVVDLLRARMADLEAQGAEGSGDWCDAKVAIELATHEWDRQRDGWEAAGWNDHYWGGPWWPTDNSG
jgi:hypothetical protein